MYENNGGANATSTEDYNRGQDIGDIGSAAIGAFEIGNGAGTMKAGGVVVLTTGETGVGAIVGAGQMVGGALEMAHATMMMSNGTNNFKNQKGRIEGSGTKSGNSSYNSVPDPKNVGGGKSFTSAQKKKLLDANRETNGGG